MAFESHVLENGQWVSRTNNLNDLLNRTNTTRPARQTQQAPQCGILTRTVFQSSIAHWVLPVRLRSSKNNDVAFVGDHFVQISELRRDGQLHGISRKCDFGSRIRNAKVIGSSPVIVNGEEYATTGFHSEAAEDDMDGVDPYIPTPASSASSASILPPQLLLIALETGANVFLFLRQGQDGAYEFVAVQDRVPSQRLVRPGYHLAVDPSSRFVVSACARNFFVVHELESMHRLKEDYARGLPLKPILSSRPRTVNGVIHTVEFLYPRPQDPKHIILLLIVVKDGVSRMITYDWMLGDDLREEFALEKSGHALPPQHEMPLMVIPLTVRSAFLAVSEGEIAYCADALQGSPSFEPCDIKDFEPSEDWSSRDPPLWTAWSRPPRLYPYHRDRDFIYIAREDGVVIYLECDSDDILGAYFYHGTFCSVSTAFASLADEFHDGEALVNGETLVFGGDSGQGGASPRKVITKLCRIPNWAPAVDFVTTAESSRWDNTDGAASQLTGSSGQNGINGLQPAADPDKVYVAAGRGKDGSIVAYRHGLQANIGIELDLGTVVRDCFMFQGNDSDPESGYHIILAIAGKSVMLSFDSNFTATSSQDVEQDQAAFDLDSPTLLAAPVQNGIILQVTERGITFVTPMESAQFTFASLGLDGGLVTHVALEEDILALTSHAHTGFKHHAIRINARQLRAEHLYTEPFDEGEVTAFSLCRKPGMLYAIASLWVDKAVYLAFYCISTREHIRTVSLSELSGSELSIEPITSIVFVDDQDTGNTVLVAGTRDGLAATTSFSNFHPLQAGAFSLSRVGHVPVHVYAGREPGSVFLCCDTGLFLASGFHEGHGFTHKRNVWTIDAEDSSKPSPAITSVTVLPKSLSGNEANVPLLLLATDRVLLAELQPQVGPVQRHLPLGMTPCKLLYSHVLKCLVVAAETAEGATTLKFIDPETGSDLSLPVSGSTREPVQYISGLGKAGDKILCLEEWHVRSDSGHDHYYILVSTRGGEDGGRVLIVSPRQEKPRSGERRSKIQFWTRYKLKKSDQDSAGPISAVTASDRKIQSSMGSEILCHELDEGQKRITQKTSFPLGGPAWKLSILPGGSRTLALVKGDSVRVLEQSDDGEETSLGHVSSITRPVLDMLEVAGAWEGPKLTPMVSDPPQSIILVSDQCCSVMGIWVPWDSPGAETQVLFEADLPSSVRRLRLGRTLPNGSREKRREKKFGFLPASVDDAEILGLGIDGSMQHFTLLDINIWRFLRFIQNVAETSPDLYPFTFTNLDGGEDGDQEYFDPAPDVCELSERQVDGDLMQRCFDKRALEGLLSRNEEWLEMFVEYLDRVDDGRWTRDFASDDEDDIEMDGDERRQQYFKLAYGILEYFLVPVI